MLCIIDALKWLHIKPISTMLQFVFGHYERGVHQYQWKIDSNPIAKEHIVWDHTTPV
jgi:hypothetical protein